MISLLGLFVLGLLMLWAGAEFLVRYTSRFAKLIGVSPIIIGLSVVSLGTSAPEFVVSLVAALQGQAGISIGNIVGSNIANVGLILGIGALITPLTVQKSWVKREVPVMIFVTLLFILLAYLRQSIDRLDGGILFVFLLLFLGYLARYSLREMSEFRELERELRRNGNYQSPSWKKKLGYLLLSLFGLVVLILGSKLTVDAGVEIAERFGVSDLIIGLTLVAFGTSLPELATTIVGAIRKETDIVVGNIIGSNIFNLLFIGGVIPIVHPLPIDQKLISIHFPILIVLSLVLFPIMKVQLNIRRVEGLFLLVMYGIFLYLTIIHS